jgi:hypothetical protein
MCPTSNQTPSEVCAESKRLEISPSESSPGNLAHGMGGKSSAGEGAESGFKAGPNYKQGKKSGRK